MTPTRRPLSEANCPVARAVDVLADKWTLLILKNANLGMTRFDQFRADLEIADNILSARLGRLVALGLMVRLPYENLGRTRHEYRLTEAGTDVLPILRSFAEWGHEHTTINGAPTVPITFIHHTCGNRLENGQHCPSCDVEVAREDQAWVRPWRNPVVTKLSEPVEATAPPVSY
jgi:DNA-binding HxlR family transcriptional regulator